jgi:hypothetical protein
MIAVKTKMRHIPAGCSHCIFYSNRKYTQENFAFCRALTGYGSYGKPINPYREKKYKTTNERPKWCPLVEIEGKKAERMGK